MKRKEFWTAGRGFTLAAMLTLAAAGCSSPTKPTTTTTTTSIPPEVVADPPTLTCPAAFIASTILRDGTTVKYALPVAEKGKEPVTVTCAPPPDSRFPLGDSAVECTASDALARTASCTLYVRVELLPSLRKTRFLAFGDSITAGEVTFPIGATALGIPSFKQVLVPSAAYPAVLAKTLQAAYKAQEDLIAVANYGQGGEKAAVARDRFIAALPVVRPDAVLIMMGANDIPLGEDGAASVAANEVRIMSAEARLRGMRVFIATLPPSRSGGNRAIKQFLLDDYNGRMRDVARTEGAVLVDIHTALSTNVNLYIGVDGLHPTEAGYAKIAETFFNAIRTEFEVR